MQERAMNALATTPTQTTPNTDEVTHSEFYQDRKIQYHPPQLPGGGPPCIWDNGPTQRAGSCFVCILCGNSTACG